MTRPQRILAALTLSVAAAACSPREAMDGTAAGVGSKPVATVNGREIPESLLRVYTLAVERRNLDELEPADRERLLNDLIGVELLSQEAQKNGLAASRTLAAQLELQRLQLVARTVATDYLEKNPPTETELQQIYEENLPRLSGQQYKARHILVETQEEASGVIAELRAGADFTVLATQRASGLTGPNGGALGWVTPDSMPKPFIDAVRTLTPGNYTIEPVRTDAGFHVILLEDVSSQEPPALIDIRDQLVGAAENKRVADYLKALRDSATVDIEP